MHMYMHMYMNTCLYHQFDVGQSLLTYSYVANCSQIVVHSLKLYSHFSVLCLCSQLQRMYNATLCKHVVCFIDWTTISVFSLRYSWNLQMPYISIMCSKQWHSWLRMSIKSSSSDCGCCLSLLKRLLVRSIKSTNRIIAHTNANAARKMNGSAMCLYHCMQGEFQGRSVTAWKRVLNMCYLLLALEFTTPVNWGYSNFESSLFRTSRSMLDHLHHDHHGHHVWWWIVYSQKASPAGIWWFVCEPPNHQI